MILLYETVINDNFSIRKIYQRQLSFSKRSSKMIFLCEEDHQQLFFYRERPSTMTLLFEKVINHDFSIRKAH